MMKPEEISDEGLVRRISLGDRALLGALFDRHHGAVTRFLWRFSGAREGLDDLVQATFLEALKSAASFRGSASVRTWLLGIAANVARHHARSELRRRTALTAFAALESPLPATPQRTLESRETIERLNQALRGLPGDLRTAFVLCDVEETRGVDAARKLGLREGTLYRRLHDARHALRHALAD